MIACCLTSSSLAEAATPRKSSSHLRRAEPQHLPATEPAAAGEDNAAIASVQQVDTTTTANATTATNPSSDSSNGLSPLEIQSRIGPKVGRIQVPNTDYTLSRISYGKPRGGGASLPACDVIPHHLP